MAKANRRILMGILVIPRFWQIEKRKLLSSVKKRRKGINDEY
jgi:hypothetical protein